MNSILDYAFTGKNSFDFDDLSVKKQQPNNLSKMLALSLVVVQ